MLIHKFILTHFLKVQKNNSIIIFQYIRQHMKRCRFAKLPSPIDDKIIAFIYHGSDSQQFIINLHHIMLFGNTAPCNIKIPHNIPPLPFKISVYCVVNSIIKPPFYQGIGTHGIMEILLKLIGSTHLRCLVSRTAP